MQNYFDFYFVQISSTRKTDIYKATNTTGPKRLRSRVDYSGKWPKTWYIESLHGDNMSVGKVGIDVARANAEKAEADLNSLNIEGLLVSVQYHASN